MMTTTTNTLRIGCLFALLLGLSALQADPARAQLGIAAGANFDEFSDIEADAERTTGYHVGLFYDMHLGPLALRPGVFYMDVGEVDFEGDEVENFNMRLIEIPVDVRFRFGTTPFIKPYATVGPVFRINASDTDDFEGEVEDFSLAANAGLGLELNLSGLRLFPEVRYAFGISKIADEVGVDSDEARLNTFMVRLGIAF